MKPPVRPACTLAVVGSLLAAGCGDADSRSAPEPTDTAIVSYAPAPAARRAPPPMAGDFPELSSKDCAEVVRFYLEAIRSGEYDRAALVWNDPMIDAVRLRALFGDYQDPVFEWTDPFVDGAAGSLSCTAGGTLFDAEDPAKPIVQGTLTLRRVNDVPGATPVQLRWTLQSSTFVEELQRTDGG